MHWASLVVFLFALFYHTEGISLKADGNNVCERNVPFMQTYAVKYKQPQVRTYREPCFDWSQGLMCKVQTTIYVDAYKTASREMNRTEYYCCDGWTQDGAHCNIAVCSSECLNGGTCTFPEICECPPEFHGNHCQDDVNECLLNNGGCSQECTNELGGFSCSCDLGFLLDHNNKTCSDHDECATSSHECRHQCVNNEGSYFCVCPDGFELMSDGKSCKEIDECASSPCEHICSDLIASYHCSCRSGYSLASDSVSCDPICSQGCGNGGYCSVPEVCHCSEGWKGYSCETPECSSGCVHGVCELPDVCVCGTGWNGTTCDDDIDECSHDNGGCSDACENFDGSYECSCFHGYTLSENLHDCSDNDECKGDSHGCDYCVNTVGSYECVCPEGFILENGTKCWDFNECTGSPCMHSCINTEGSFHCGCEPGFALNVNGLDCSDVDECMLNEHKCSHTCVNTKSWYKCACHSGFKLASDGFSCDDIDECSDVTLNDCEQNCVNLKGNYRCECRAGYATTERGCEAVCVPPCHNGGYCKEPGVCACASGWEGKYCETDIDECITGMNNCDQSCNNVGGGYLCLCYEGFQLVKGHKCVDKDECAINGTAKCEQRCSNTLGSYICSCEEGYFLDTNGFSCSDHDECSKGTHGCDLCANTQGSFSCYCLGGFELEENGQTCKPVCEPDCEHGGVCVHPNTCECNDKWKGAGCQWEVTKNHWTLNSTGCQCYFDNSRYDCACCGLGGCQCTDTNYDKCVQCGYGHTCDDMSDKENNLGTNSWTLSDTGCPCLVNRTYDLTNNNCACCQNGGCPCGEINPQQCVQCGQPYTCDIKNLWNREL